MNDEHLVGHCGKILPHGTLCYPPLCDDFCPGCPLNGYEFEREEREREEAERDEHL